MARITPVDPTTATPEQAANVAWIEDNVGTATNMKRTLAYSKPAVDALLEWYPLRDAVLPIIGERGVTLFCHAISTGNECALCSVYFRRELIDAGEDPEHLVIDEPEMTLVAYGARLATDPNNIDDDLFSRLTTFYSPEQIVTLTAFGTLMIATNVFNNALDIDIDSGLERYEATTAKGSSDE